MFVLYVYYEKGFPTRTLSITSRPAEVSVCITSGTFTPSLRALSSPRASAFIRARVSLASKLGWRYCFLNRCFTTAKRPKNVVS